MTHDETNAAVRESLCVCVTDHPVPGRRRAADAARVAELEQALGDAIDLLTASRMFPKSTADLRAVLGSRRANSLGARSAA